jgi:hypothetical protein
MSRTMTQITRKILVVLAPLAAIGLGGCKTRLDDESRVKVVNGKALKETDFPAVIQIGFDLGGGALAMCSATWISDRTVLTAAHCIEGADRSPSKVSIVRGTGKGLRASRAISHPTYRPNSGVGHDIAVLVFKEQSSKYYIPVALTQAKAGDPLTIIGFGKFDHLNGKSGGTKRMGTNKVSAIDYQGRVDFVGLVSPLNEKGTGESVTNSQGDSGGPMIIKSRVQGVSSSVSKAANNKNTGHYESVRAPAIKDWLSKLAASGVYILGFSQGTEGITATDTTVSGQGGEPEDSGTQPPESQEVAPPAPGDDLPDSPGTPESDAAPQPAPAPTPAPSPTPNAGSLLDCNRDFSTIRQGGQGICRNSSSGFCYRYSNRDVQYSLGQVTCAASSDGAIGGGGTRGMPGIQPNQNPNTNPRPTLLDCNRNFNQIRAGGSGICRNSSSGFCYRYSNRNVQYGLGRVSCP